MITLHNILMYENKSKIIILNFILNIISYQPCLKITNLLFKIKKKNLGKFCQY